MPAEPVAGRSTGMTRWIERQGWALQRFGLSASTLPGRLGRSGPRPVLLVSVPKSGTHLLERALCLHPRLYRKLAPTLSAKRLRRWGGLDGLVGRMRGGQVAVAHLRFAPDYPAVLERGDVRTMFMIRDPRDVLVSLVHFAPGRTDFLPAELYARHPGLQDRLRVAIVGDREHKIPSIGARLEMYRGWLDSGALVVRFEDLIGTAGGGDDERQLRTLEAVYRHAGVETDRDLLRSNRDRLFSRASPTFRRGTVGQGGDLFTPELDRLYRETAGDILAAYGY